VKNKQRLILFILSFSFLTFAQERKQIEIEYAPYMTFEEDKPDATILTRDDSDQVHIKHKGIEMWCDEAIYYGKEDFIEAYGSVRVKQGDSINMTSKYVEYSGKTQLAYASGDVVLIDPDSKLYTDVLHFDRIKQQAYYNQKGRVVRDTSGTITSTVGRYYVNSKKYQFVDNVKLINPEYEIDTERLDFYTESGYAFMFGPTTITSETSVIYCERGFYNTNNDTGHFVKKSKINYDDRIVEGDSVYFNRNKNFASATNNITVTDTLNKSIIKGHYAEVFREKDSVFITKRALAITEQENDSIFMHSDTLMVTGPADERIIRGFYNAKMFKSNLSGKADSIHMNQKTGLTQLINFYDVDADAFSKKEHPVLWHFESQITGDSIHLISNTKKETLDSLKVFNSAFVISKDSLGDGFNQISGKVLYGLFENNELNTIDVIKNAETIYYLRNSENELVGIDKSKSGSIKIFISENQIDELRKINQIGGKTYPEEDFPEKEIKLKGFVWRNEERPKTVDDLFSDDPPLELVKIKGLESYIPQAEFFDEDLIKRVEDAGNLGEDLKNKQKNKSPKKDNKAARNLPLEKINKMQKSAPKRDEALKPKTLKKQI
jgi:lipopolysaccharide export system protein LptA|tara:strand:- start:5793 stop:7610 length:1818 start_codon:yes stop_codon:yes gene_type:complete